MDVQVDFFQAHLEGRRQCGFCSNGRCHDEISIAFRGGVPDPKAKAHPRRLRLLTLWLLSRRSSMVAGFRSPRRVAEVPRVVRACFRRRLIPALRLDRDFSLPSPDKEIQGHSGQPATHKRCSGAWPVIDFFWLGESPCGGPRSTKMCFLGNATPDRCSQMSTLR